MSHKARWWLAGPMLAIAWLCWLAPGLIPAHAATRAVPAAYAQNKTAHAYAQGKAVVVERRDGDVTIKRNGDVRVVESWRVRFMGGPFTHAFRTIPLNRVENIDGWGVAEGGHPYGSGAGTGDRYYEVSDSGTARTITWYFPETTDATRTFTLSYTLHGALRIYGGGDQFYWTFVEGDRAYTIDAARVVVHLPAAFSPASIKATAYRNGSESAADAQRLDGRATAFTGGPFAPGDAWEIRTQFSHGLVAASAPPWQVTEERQPVFNLVALVAAMLVLIGGLLGVFLLWFTRGRDPAAGLVAEFYTAPPDDSPPGVAGTLLDEKADMQDIIATLVDLARRGYLHIVEESAPGARGHGGTPDFLFVRQGAGTGPLHPYEQTLLTTVFAHATERRLSDLRQKFYTALPGLQRALLDETIRAGYFPRNPATTRQIYLWLGIGLLALAGLGVWAALSSFVTMIVPLAVLVPLAVGLVAVGMIVVSPSMPKRTAQGATAAARWRAFRRYLQHIDRYTQVDTATEQFERYLPYAVAFGLERRWVKAFEAAPTPMPAWYFPYGYGYSPHYAGSGSARSGSQQSGGGRGGAPSLDTMARGSFTGLTAMSSGFFAMLDTTASVFTSRPASSSGGSGGWSGGGSGGGGGGGGGSSGFG